MNSTMTLEQSAHRLPADIYPKGARGIGEAILNWLGRIGERSAGARSAAAFRRLNALSDEQLAAVGLKRSELLTYCFGWRAHY